MVLKGKKVLVVGASGKIGSQVARSLREFEAEVYGAARFSDNAFRQMLEQEGLSTIRYDAKTDDPRELPDVDLVILEIWDPKEHKGPNARDSIWSLNYNGVGRIVERYAARAHIINGCSGNIYGTNSEPFDEEQPARPNTEYGLARFAQERLIDFLTAGTSSRVIHLRYFFGNSSRSGQLYRAARAIRERRPMEGAADQLIQVIAVEDLVDLTVRAVQLLDGGKSQAVNICHPEVYRRREIARWIRRELGHGRIRFESRSGLEKSLVGSPERMLNWLGSPKIPVDELIRRAVTAAAEDASVT